MGIISAEGVLGVGVVVAVLVVALGALLPDSAGRVPDAILAFGVVAILYVVALAYLGAPESPIRLVADVAVWWLLGVGVLALVRQRVSHA